MIATFGLYLLSFLTIWFGAGLIISSVDILSKRIHISRFLISFFMLGILTSIPEIAVGIVSVFEQKPEIFVGNLLGGIPVLFLFVTPVLAILGSGVRINHGFEQWRMIAALAVILTPSIFVLDGVISNTEAGVMILLYVILLFLLKSQFVEKYKKQKPEPVGQLGVLLLKIIIGSILVFISSHVIVDKTMEIAKTLHISPFYLSLIGISLGTNLPELSLAIRAILQKKKDIAFGDYMGSAAANTLLFGIFSLLINGYRYSVQNYVLEFIILAVGLILFYYFSKSQRNISRNEGFVLVGIFLFFCFVSLN